mmetsp:Transcript_11766/g.30234  ORF Transcript_11766/g.30234 Transcript_11766/m.30234 type:complete len:104 (-) Transcript_11766:1107-1418(-)
MAVEELRDYYDLCRCDTSPHDHVIIPALGASLGRDSDLVTLLQRQQCADLVVAVVNKSGIPFVGGELKLVVLAPWTTVRHAVYHPRIWNGREALRIHPECHIE